MTWPGNYFYMIQCRTPNSQHWHTKFRFDSHTEELDDTYNTIAMDKYYETVRLVLAFKVDRNDEYSPIAIKDVLQFVQREVTV
jgi:hypothetical protein